MKKLIKIYIYFFLCIKMVNKYYQKQKKSFEKKHAKKYQSLSEEEKRQKKAWDRYQNLSEEEKERKVDYMRNYYLAHKKYILSWFVDFGGPGTILFHGLVFEMLK